MNIVCHYRLRMKEEKQSAMASIRACCFKLFFLKPPIHPKFDDRGNLNKK